ncbi:helicase-like protein [Saccharothrix saharensis]|uniref:Helicase-like protein n=1 Tax=Saccharothrix saharensis TaxID=571190 RepID=A0A543JR86_9PSEU|nr:SNF2-related protein [Saccharothrix saharensis]TQM85275.1 helicase-like protein [Saccharothrix saharensis]
MSTPGRAADQAHRPSKAATRAVDSLIQRAAELQRAPRTLRRAAAEQITAVVHAEATARVQELSADELKPFVGRSIRLNALINAGFSTIGRIEAASRERLMAIPNVGGQTADVVLRAARDYRERLARDSEVEFDPDHRTPHHTRLLGLLFAIRGADVAVSDLDESVARFRERSEPLLERAGSNASILFKLSLLFRRGRRNAAKEALDELALLAEEPDTLRLAAAIERAERATDPRVNDPDRLWRLYLSDAAAVHALLSTLVTDGGHDDVARGQVDSELGQKVDGVSLDVSLLKPTLALRRYQVFGAQYAIHQKRVILGDEMGLGKTVQALAVFAHLAATGAINRFMVICPASVQVNWLNEIEKHSLLKAFSLYGNDKEENTRQWLREGGIAVTTFTTLGRLKTAEQVELSALVVDEAHQVKNPHTLRSQDVSKVIDRAQRVLFLTGTPMENRVEEFRNLVQHLDSDQAAAIDPADALHGAKAFRRAVASIYLRRNREDVLKELKGRIEVEDWVRLTPTDEKVYRDAVDSGHMMDMRRALLTSEDSAKMGRLVDIVEEAVEDGRKVVVFSFFLEALAILHKRLGDVAIGPLVGKVTPVGRQAMVDELTERDGPAVLLSQISTGGLGLNIQAASVVVIADPQWTPGSEDQAIGRAHRMGQVHTVQVHRLLAKDSIDERIREVVEHKKLLFDEFARKSEAKSSDVRAVDSGFHRPEVLDDAAIPLDRRMVMAERYRLELRDTDGTGGDTGGNERRSSY